MNTEQNVKHNNITVRWTGERWEDDRENVYHLPAYILRCVTADLDQEYLDRRDRLRAVGAAALAGVMPQVTPTDDYEKDTFRAAWDYAKSIRESGTTILGVNLLVFSERYRIVGTVDLALRNGQTTHLMAWHPFSMPKTDTNHQWCKPPLDHLVDTPSNHLALELALLTRVLRDEQYIQRRADVELDIITAGPDGCVSDKLPSLELEAADALLHHLYDIPY